MNLFLAVDLFDIEPMLKNLINIITGTNSHWIGTHNKVIANISQKIDKLNSEDVDLLRKFVLCSYSTVDLLLGPNRDKSLAIYKFSQSDIKSLTEQDFFAIYKELIKLHMSLCCILNKFSYPYIHSLYFNLFDEEVILPEVTILEEQLVNDIVYKGINAAFAHLPFLNTKDPSLQFILFTSITSSYKSTFI